MNTNVFTIALYAVAGFFLLFSFFKDKRKTRAALLKAWKAFENILPQLLGVFLLIGLSLSYLEPYTVGRFSGERSGWLGVAIAAVAGAVTLIPGFVAFPTAALLLRGGAGLMQMTAFVSRYKFFLIVLVPFALVLAFQRSHGEKAVGTLAFSVREMLSVLPPIFILLGSMDAWVPRETVGPLYAAFPVAAFDEHPDHRDHRGLSSALLKDEEKTPLYDSAQGL